MTLSDFLPAVQCMGIHYLRTVTPPHSAMQTPHTLAYTEARKQHNNGGKWK